MISVLNHNIEQLVKDDALKYKNEAFDGYDFWEEHIQYVVENALLLAEKYNANMDVVRIGALLHDIALVRKVGGRGDHHINGEKITRSILGDAACDKEFIERVCRCVLNHRSSHNASTIEEICVADADILAHFDNVTMLFRFAFKDNNTTLEEAREWMRKALIKDYNDLSDLTKLWYKNKFDLLCDTLLKEKLKVE